MSLTQDSVLAALARVRDPEIQRPITELGMIDSVEIKDASLVVHVLLTIPGCPLKSTLDADIRAVVEPLLAGRELTVSMGSMNQEQRLAMRRGLRGGDGSRPPTNPFAEPGNLTRVYAVASGKGGVGKSSVTANLAVALAARGLQVGILDADVHGFSIPRIMGLNRGPTRVDDMILPPIVHGVKVISIGSFVAPGKAVIWRGPMLHRAVEQFLTDVFWGDLDVLLLDLPPGTGDVAISVAQLLPNAELLVVTTPQVAASEVAERAGLIATQTSQKVAGVIENMSWLEIAGVRHEIFGSGGGAAIAAHLSALLGVTVPLLAQVPLDPTLREHGDAGIPVTLVPAGVALPALVNVDSPVAADALHGLAAKLAQRPRGLDGLKLPIIPIPRPQAD